MILGKVLNSVKKGWREGNDGGSGCV